MATSEAYKQFEARQSQVFRRASKGTSKRLPLTNPCVSVPCNLHTHLFIMFFAGFFMLLLMVSCARTKGVPVVSLPNKMERACVFAGKDNASYKTIVQMYHHTLPIHLFSWLLQTHEKHHSIHSQNRLDHQNRLEKMCFHSPRLDSFDRVDWDAAVAPVDRCHGPAEGTRPCWTILSLPS